MPSRRPTTPRTRDQLVAHDASTDKGKERMIAETARAAAEAGVRIARLDARPAVEGSRASGEALVSLLETLSSLGLITDKTTV